ncbi:phage tail protein [Celerinatantimonas yamalensis]|uniref:Tail fiber protein n=1 Tax=Celerinatantimonas yamalensis TaxID=559956 RepID=A0ABW9G986_9GAMM
MSEPFLGQISMFGFKFAPKDWAWCDGRSLSISQNQALYALLGVTYGGDGKSYFNLPDLRGRTPIHWDGRFAYSFKQGISGGQESVALTAEQMPSHHHAFYAASENADKGTINADVTVLAPANKDNLAYPVYGPANHLALLTHGSCSDSGGDGAHLNLQPSQVINFCISLRGDFPMRS